MDNTLADALKRSRMAGMEHTPGPRNAFASDRSAIVNSLALSTGFVPGIGDIAGLAADADMYATDPKSRNWRNYLMTGLGVLPFIPALASMGRATKNVPTGFGNEVGAIGYHGTYGDFNPADVSKRGSVTGARSANEATWFTDDPKTAGAYAVYAAEDGPVKAALAEAERLEKKAQRSGSQADWDAYDAKMREAEALDAYASRTDRRGQANVYEVDIPDELDLLSIDAQGKTPWELSQEADIDSFLTAKVLEARRMGKAGARFNNLDDAVNLSNRPATHYALFYPSVVKMLGRK
jgi:hypothetical protein